MIRKMPSDTVIRQFACKVQPIMGMFNWHWSNGAHCGVPSVNGIQKRLTELCRNVCDGTTDCTRTGGFIVDWNEEESRVEMAFCMSIEADYDEEIA